MDFHGFFQKASELNLGIETAANGSETQRSSLLGNEALFQLPFLSMVVLTLASCPTKPDRANIGQLVGECLERTLAGFKGTSQLIGWSANLRIRTVKALVFLEQSDLVEVNDNTRRIAATEIGRSVLKIAMDGIGELAPTLGHIDRNYRNMTAEAKTELTLQ